MSLFTPLKVPARLARAFFFRNSPVYSHLYVTRRCNLKCVMCNVWHEQPADPSLEEVRLMIDRLDRLGIAFIQLTGGEPFLRRDISPTLSPMPKAAGSRFLSAPMAPCPRPPTSAFRGLRLDGIGVSLHSIKPQVHEEINAMPGSWQKAVDTIHLLRDMGQPVYVCSVISSLNHEETAEIVRFCDEELKVTVGLQPAVVSCDDGLSFRAKNDELRTLTPAQVQQVSLASRTRNSRRTRSFQHKSFDVLASKKVDWKCRAGEMFFAVMSDGKVGICQDIFTDINILDNDALKKFKSKEFRMRAGPW
jgi:MoaA/NifB/PqqE/SkfB family radical SAM enzyme